MIDKVIVKSLLLSTSIIAIFDILQEISPVFTYVLILNSNISSKYTNRENRFDSVNIFSSISNLFCSTQEQNCPMCSMHNLEFILGNIFTTEMNAIITFFYYFSPQELTAVSVCGLFDLFSQKLLQ